MKILYNIAHESQLFCSYQNNVHKKTAFHVFLLSGKHQTIFLTSGIWLIVEKVYEVNLTFACDLCCFRYSD